MGTGFEISKNAFDAIAYEKQSELIYIYYHQHLV